MNRYRRVAAVGKRRNHSGEVYPHNLDTRNR